MAVGDTGAPVIDDEFAGMLAEFRQRPQACRIGGYDEATNRVAQIVTNVGAMVAALGSDDEATVQRNAGMDRMRDVVAMHCGEIQAAVVLMWLWTGRSHATGGEDDRRDVDLSRAYRDGLAERTCKPVATWARLLLVSAFTLQDVVASASRTMYLTSNQWCGQLARNVELVLPALQSRLAAFAALQGVDVVASTLCSMAVAEVAGPEWC
jgi:hypothetical protein